MSGIAVSARVIARDNFGRFISECEAAATKTAEELVKTGAELARGFAPVGSKPDLRTIPLTQGISWRMTGATSGEFYAPGRQALPQEFGAGAHTITGNPGLSFFWEAEGRRFVPASVFYHQPDAVTVVNHPGNPPQPYLRPAYEAVMGMALRVAASNYPG